MFILMAEIIVIVLISIFFFISIKLNQTALGIAQQSSCPGEGYFQVFLSRNKYSLPEN